MTTEELFQAVDWIKVTMIAVATGGPRINEVNSEFVKKYDELVKELASRRAKNTFPYRDLWQWYARWSSGDMPSYQSRRTFVNALADELISNVQQLSEGTVAAHEPTGWARVDRTVTEARKQLELATTEEQFQAVALFCREILISLAQAVFDPERHPTLDGVRASNTDAKRMLEAYIAVEFAGSGNEHTRKHAKAACDLAVHLQHRRTATFREAAACVEATTSTVNLIAITAGLRDPSPPSCAPTIPGLNEVDTHVLNALGELFIETKNSRFPRYQALTRQLYKKNILDRLQWLNLHPNQIDESLEMLSENGLISGVHTTEKFYEVKLEFPGVAKIIRQHFPELDSYYPQIAAKIVHGARTNDAISETLSLPLIVVNYVLDDFLAQELLRLRKDVNGTYHIFEVSTRLTRMVRG